MTKTETLIAVLIGVAIGVALAEMVVSALIVLIAVTLVVFVVIGSTMHVQWSRHGIRTDVQIRGGTVTVTTKKAAAKSQEKAS